MKTSKRALQFIKDHEGLKLKAYKDTGGVWTIGYGHTSDAKLKVTKDTVITKAQAEELLRHDVSEAEDMVDKYAVQAVLNGNQYGAVVSFIFNVGGVAFKKSTLCKKLNKNDYVGASKEFDKWVYDKEASPDPLPGLIRRRAEEKALFNTPERLANKIVNQPKITFVTEETQIARNAKAKVTAPKTLPKGTKETLTAGGLLTAFGLNEWFGVWNQVKDYVGDYGPYILGGLFATGVVLFGIRYFRRVD